jgi:hypothetical protein
MTRYRLAGFDHEPPTGETRKLTHCQFYGLGTADQIACFVKQQLASFGCGDAPPHAMKQFCAEFPLERSDCRRYLGRCQSEGVGRLREVFAFGNRDKDLQLVECHAAVPEAWVTVPLST